MKLGDRKRCPIMIQIGTIPINFHLSHLQMSSWQKENHSFYFCFCQERSAQNVVQITLTGSSHWASVCPGLGGGWQVSLSANAGTWKKTPAFFYLVLNPACSKCWLLRRSEKAWEHWVSTSKFHLAFGSETQPSLASQLESVKTRRAGSGCTLA